MLSPRGGDLYPNFHGLKKPGVAEVIAKGYRAADRIVSISSWISERLETVCSPHPLPPTTIVFNGLDLDAWDAEARGAEAIEPVVEGSFTLQLARVAPVKRQDLAVDAMEKLAGAYRERGLRHAIVGEGELLEPLAPASRSAASATWSSCPGRSRGGRSRGSTTTRASSFRPPEKRASAT